MCPFGVTVCNCDGPFLRYASTLLEHHEHNVLKACADDIGAVLAHFTGLRQLSHFFQYLGLLTNLHLNVPKCNIVLLTKLTTQQKHGYVSG